MQCACLLLFVTSFVFVQTEVAKIDVKKVVVIEASVSVNGTVSKERISNLLLELKKTICQPGDGCEDKNSTQDANNRGTYNNTTSRPWNATSHRPFNYTTSRPWNVTSYRPWNATSHRPFNYTTSRPWNATSYRPFNYTTSRPWNVTSRRPFNYTTITPWNFTAFRTRNPWYATSYKPYDYTSRRPWEASSNRPYDYTSRRPWEASSKRPYDYTSRRPWDASSNRPYDYTTRRPWDASSNRPYDYTTRRPWDASSNRPYDYTSRRPWDASSNRPYDYTTRRPWYASSNRPYDYTTRRPWDASSNRPYDYTTRRPWDASSDRPYDYTTRRPWDASSDRPYDYTTRRPWDATTSRPDVYTTEKPWKGTTNEPGLSLLDCSDLPANSPSGVYKISTEHGPLEVFCDMNTDGGNWTVIQSHNLFSSLNLDKTWKEYRDGFGSIKEAFWLGNKHLSAMTAKRDYSLRVDMSDMDGNSLYAKYAYFLVASENHKFRLVVGGFSGDAEDGLSSHSGSPFSTRDMNNDRGVLVSCSQRYGGGWWYIDCYKADLNGYQPTWSGTRLLNVEMKIRPGYLNE